MKGNGLYNADEIALKLLHFYNDGEFAYDENSNTTEKQRNLKREFKKFIEETMSAPAKKRAVIALQSTILGLTDINKLRAENNELHKTIKQYKKEVTGSKELVKTLFKDQFRKEIKEELYLEYGDDLENSRIANRKLLAKMEETNIQMDNMRISHREQIDEMETKMYEINTLMYQKECNIKVKKTKEEKEQERIEKQIAKLQEKLSQSKEQSSDEEVEIITENI
tara:strand:+ start:322 stop:993 length:672 start_codon:yes stop_codon:yes gene_type:complete